MTGQALIKALKLRRPDVVITVTREHDPHFVWDGDGPDPAESGFMAFDVNVTATAIHGGEFVSAHSSLGGSYFAPDEEVGEVHGYLLQMVQEAVRELGKALGGTL